MKKLKQDHIILISAVTVVVIAIIISLVMNQGEDDLGADSEEELSDIYLESECTGPNHIPCSDIARDGDNIRISLENSLGNDIVLLNIKFQGEEILDEDCMLNFTGKQDAWKNGEMKEFVVPCDIGKDDVTMVDFLIDYFLPEQGRSITHSVRFDGIIVE